MRGWRLLLVRRGENGGAKHGGVVGGTMLLRAEPAVEKLEPMHSHLAYETKTYVIKRKGKGVTSVAAEIPNSEIATVKLVGSVVKSVELCASPKVEEGAE
ncbi:hypothetical protein Ancab_029040 [Ancistrocladus abbreviatus]